MKTAEEIGFGKVRIEGFVVKEDGTEKPFEPVVEDVKGGGPRVYLVKDLRVDSVHQAKQLARELTFSRFHINNRWRRQAERGRHPGATGKPKPQKRCRGYYERMFLECSKKTAHPSGYCADHRAEKTRA